MDWKDEIIKGEKIETPKCFYNLINWSEVSRLLTNDRTAIRSDYSGKKYKHRINRLKRLVDLWVRWAQK